MALETAWQKMGLVAARSHLIESQNQRCKMTDIDKQIAVEVLGWRRGESDLHWFDETGS